MGVVRQGAKFFIVSYGLLLYNVSDGAVVPQNILILGEVVL